MSKYRISLEGKIYEMEVQKVDEITEALDSRLSLNWSTDTKISTVNPNVQVIDPAVSKKTTNENNVVYSPMPGTIIKILVHNGDKVKKGQAVLVLEAMKMENEIIAPMDGTISCLDVAENVTVQGKTKLFEIVD